VVAGHPVPKPVESMHVRRHHERGAIGDDLDRPCPRRRGDRLGGGCDLGGHGFFLLAAGGAAPYQSTSTTTEPVECPGRVPRNSSEPPQRAPMLAADVPTYTIDLEVPEANRWAEVIAAERAAAARLAAEAASELQRVPELLRRAFARLYQLSGGLYRGE